MTTSPYTQAHNFFSAVSGGVDPRTGLFMFNFPVSNFNGNNTLGPTLPLALSYCPLDSSNDYQLGTGITPGLSCYNRNSRDLILSSGERHRVVDNQDDDGQQPVIRQQKIDNVHFTRQNDGYTLCHKSGLVEILAEQRSGIFLPVTLRSPAGYYLALNWEISPWYSRLLDISDSRGKTVVIFTYHQQQVEMVLWPDTGEEQIIILEMQNDYLVKIRNASVTPELQWDLQWDDESQINEKNILRQISSPTKLIQQVEYTNGLMRYAIADVSGSYPAVTRYRQYSADDSQMAPVVQTFSYSTASNYLGYGETYSAFAADDDNLYGILTPYDYFSLQTLKGNGDDIPDRIIERHYNNYHLLVSEKHTQSGSDSQLLQETRYFAVVGESFDQQPTTFQLPEQQTLSWTNAAGETRTEVTRYQYDTFGNLTCQLSPDGSETRYGWYPAAGTENHCPAEPHGFTRFMQFRQVTPPDDFWQDSPVLTIDYQYQAIDCWNNAAPGYAVVQSQITHRANDAILSQESYQYAAAAGYETGRIQSHRVDVYGSDGEVYTSTQNFSFNADYSRDTLTQQVDSTSHDGLRLSHKRVQSVHSGLLLSETDAAANTVSYQYDPIGRLIVQTRHPDKPDYTAMQSQQYLLNPADSGLPQVLFTDIHGNQSRKTYDPLGRLLTTALNDRDHGSGWHTAVSHSYDMQGRCFHSVTTDTLNTASRSETPPAIEQSIERYWDEWSQLSRIVSKDDNLIRHSITDPVTLTTTQWTSGINGAQSSKQVTWYDHRSRLPVKTALLTLDDKIYSQQQQQWDGAGRLRRHIDENGHQTDYDYDAYGRVIKTTLPDGSVIAKQYAPFSSLALPVHISITAPGDEQGTALGTQQFDGLGRLIATSNGGRSYQHRYLHAWQQQPSTIAGPDGAVQILTSDPALGELPTAIFASHNACGGNVSQTFSYNRKTAQLSSAQEGGATHSEWLYYPSGRVQQETNDILCGGAHSSAFDYSLLGALERFQDVGGQQHQQHFSPQGYLASITSDDLLITLQYDDLKRLLSWTATDQTSAESVTTTLTRDDQGRESQRTMAFSNGEVRSIKQFWAVNNQLNSRQHLLGINTELAEYFSYDQRNRLVNYRCAGTRLPQLDSGETFTEQTFFFDRLSNIIRCETRLKNGQQHSTDYLFDNPDDPCQLTRLQTTVGDLAPTVIELHYDACGRMIRDQASRILQYDALGRLLSIQGASEYSYDAHNTLVSQKITATRQTHRLYYLASSLVNEWITAGDSPQDAAQDNNISLRYAAGSNVAEVSHEGSDSQVMLTTTDARQSLVTAGEEQVLTWSPYGVGASNPQLTDDADNVTAVAEFHFEYRDNSARTALIYSNGWNQAPVKVRLLLWDKDNQPVVLSQDQLLQDNRLKFFLHDGSPIPMQPISDTSRQLTWWPDAGDYTQVVEYKASVQFTKPVTRTLSEFNTVELEVDAWSPTATPIQQLTVSYLLNGIETPIAIVPCNDNRVNWKANWCLPAGEVTLQATIMDSDENALVTTHRLSIPAPEDRSWVVINRPLHNGEFIHNQQVPVNVSFQAQQGHKLTGIALSFDGNLIEDLPVDQPFINKAWIISMTDVTTQLTAALWSTANNEQQNHTIVLSPARPEQPLSAQNRESGESEAVIYFSTAQSGGMYQIYAQLDLPHVSDSTKTHEELNIQTLQAINYSDVSNWEMTALPDSDKNYFTGNPNQEQCYILNKEFRFKYTPADIAFLSIKNSGSTWPGGSGHFYNFSMMQPISALIGEKGEDYNLNFWCMVPKSASAESYQFGLNWDPMWWIGIYQSGSWQYDMAASYTVTDSAPQPWGYFSVYLIRICCQGVTTLGDRIGWNDFINDSVVEVTDIYGNHGTLSIRYKSGSWTPILSAN